MVYEMGKENRLVNTRLNSTMIMMPVGDENEERDLWRLTSNERENERRKRPGVE